MTAGPGGEMSPPRSRQQDPPASERGLVFTQLRYQPAGPSPSGGAVGSAEDWAEQNNVKSLPLPRVPSGEEIVEERGVPVQDDWSIAPEDDRVRFSLSGVTPHSWRERRKGVRARGPGKEGAPGAEGPTVRRLCAEQGQFLPAALGWKGCLPGEVPTSVSTSCRRLSICSGHTKAGAQVTRVTQQL